MMHIFEDLNAWRTYRQALDPRATTGFVPTLGHLHAGHASLLQRAVSENQYSFLSIFVNPTQFNDPKDYARYPRTEEADLGLARACGVTAVLLPRTQEMYPENLSYTVSEHQLSRPLEGACRPGHFDGMLTVVLKLLLLTRPTRAYFGEKDYQQLLLIQGLATAFFLDTEIVPCPTVRNQRGLALSSRNSLLSEAQQIHAARFHECLSANHPIEVIRANLLASGFEVDYLEMWQKRLMAAVRLGEIRLIDNVVKE